MKNRRKSAAEAKVFTFYVYEVFRFWQ